MPGQTSVWREKSRESRHKVRPAWVAGWEKRRAGLRTLAIQLAIAMLLIFVVVGATRLPGRAGSTATGILQRYVVSDFDLKGSWQTVLSWPWVQQVLSATGLDSYLTRLATRGGNDEGPGGTTTVLQATHFRRPVEGSVTSVFGWVADPQTGVRTYHSGIDIAAPDGTAVVAALDGRVTKVTEEPGYGKLVIVDHGSGVTTWYAHLSAITVKERQYVKQGDEIGKVGQTGTATGPHLHFEIRVNGSAVDPQLYLPSSTQ